MTFVYRKKLQIYSIFAEHIKVLYFLKVKPTNKHFFYVNITCLCLIIKCLRFYSRLVLCRPVPCHVSALPALAPLQKS